MSEEFDPADYSFVVHLPHNPLSTARRERGILMHVHPVSLESGASTTSASSVETGWTTY
jgi:hypothetical protein